VRFLVDNQLPLSLARHLVELGHEADHATDRGLEEADDRAIWQIALQEQRVVISKDEDFFSLANRVEDRGRLLWIRLGNCRKSALLSAVSKSMEQILAAYESGQRIVELG
jgi:predicted nuclease of predicted toxin-antitoxin system